nr:hypothetical protein CFP56_12125 [Quercus suber]
MCALHRSAWPVATSHQMGERAVTSTQTTEHVHYDASANDDYHTDHDSAAYEPALARESHACHGGTQLAMLTRRAFQRCSQSLGSDLCIGETDTVDACSRRTPSACPWSYLVNEDTVSCPPAPRVFRILPSPSPDPSHRHVAYSADTMSLVGPLG